MSIGQFLPKTKVVSADFMLHFIVADLNAYSNYLPYFVLEKHLFDNSKKRYRVNLGPTGSSISNYIVERNEGFKKKEPEFDIICNGLKVEKVVDDFPSLLGEPSNRFYLRMKFYRDGSTVEYKFYNYSIRSIQEIN